MCFLKVYWSKYSGPGMFAIVLSKRGIIYCQCGIISFTKKNFCANLNSIHALSAIYCMHVLHAEKQV